MRSPATTLNCTAVPSRAYCGSRGTNVGAKFVWVTVMVTVSVLLRLPSLAVTCTV